MRINKPSGKGRGHWVEKGVQAAQETDIATLKADFADLLAEHLALADFVDSLDDSDEVTPVEDVPADDAPADAPVDEPPAEDPAVG